MLDTHILLWAAADHPRLSSQARDLLLDPANKLIFSAASIWEVAIKSSLGRSDFRVDPGMLRSELLRNGYDELPVTGAHCRALTTLPAHHADPFDRLLISTAASEGLTLVTADAQIARYDGPIRHI